jgi:hypothetical protein
MRSIQRVLCIVAALAVIGTDVAAEGSDPSTEGLVGHWRKTTISFGEPRDENLVLRANGTAERWVVTARSRTPAASGLWRVDAKVLTVQIEGQQPMSLPFTFYQGQLVFPNIPNRRGFWEKIGR